MIKQTLRSSWLFRSLIIPTLVSPFFSSCVHINSAPPQASCTITLSDMMYKCHTTVNGSDVLPYKLTCTIWWIKGNDRGSLDQQNITSSTTNPLSTVTINTKCPADNTKWLIEITLTGTKCSTCALTQYSSTDICNQVATADNKNYTAALPVFYFKSNNLVGRQSPISLSVKNFIKVQNVPGSCGCLVPIN